MKHVLIPTKLDLIAKEILTEKGYNVVQDADTPLMELIQANPETQALIVRSEKVTSEVIDALPDLRVVIRAGAGYNTIDTKYARKRGVDVMNTPGANANAVAEEVLALILAGLRHIVPADISTRAGKWEKKNFMGRELTGKTLGIVGLGNIGQLVATRASGFEVKVLAYDPVTSSSLAEDLGVKLVSMEEVFSKADIVSLHIPENDQTRGTINRSLLGLMKNGAMLVNCARAGIINEADLQAVRAEKQLVFCNDVYASDSAGEKSVAGFADIMLPHLGASTVEANENAARRSAEQLIALATRGVTRYVVNKGVPDGLDERYQELAYQLGFLARHYLGSAKSVSRLECSFYGDLNQFGKWLVPPIVAGISREFEADQDPEEAVAYLREKGVLGEIRQVDAQKSYRDSITVDLFEGQETIRKVSIRGTITEGIPVISRINDFDHLYVPTQGHSLIAIYKDRPGVLAKITLACANAGINIEDIRSPHNQDQTKSIAIVKTNAPVPDEMVATIGREIEAEVVFSVSL
jgi:D-3-phosphoglycerate dehydrogenase